MAGYQQGALIARVQELDDGGVAGLDELGGVLGGLAGALLHILQDLGELGDT